MINYIRPDRPRAPVPLKRVDDDAERGSSANLTITRAEFGNRIYQYYTDKRRLIRHWHRNENVCAIVLNHKSIDSWSGADLIKHFKARNEDAESDEGGDDAAAAAPTNKASSSKLFAFAVVTGGNAASRWSTAKQSDNDIMVGAMYEYIANIRDGVFSAGGGVDAAAAAALSSYQHNIGFYEPKDDASYVFKTLHIDTSAAKLKVMGRMCEQDSNKAMFIIPRLRTLLRLMMDKDDAYIDAYINADTVAAIANVGHAAVGDVRDVRDGEFICSTNRGSLCVLTELILRYYDAVPPPILEALSPRWYLRPCEMQLLKRTIV
jgi:hypothetical protein